MKLDFSILNKDLKSRFIFIFCIDVVYRIRVLNMYSHTLLILTGGKSFVLF